MAEIFKFRPSMPALKNFFGRNFQILLPTYQDNNVFIPDLLITIVNYNGKIYLNL